MQFFRSVTDFVHDLAIEQSVEDKKTSKEMGERQESERKEGEKRGNKKKGKHQRHIREKKKGSNNCLSSNHSQKTILCKRKKNNGLCRKLDETEAFVLS